MLDLEGNEDKYKYKHKYKYDVGAGAEQHVYYNGEYMY